mmetsp:Transcript_58181/g.65951  ORF Transcript_58181/g.65951 Transcript_58181/m.65951 type:complete len:108 (-) Transcript_58181:90-413(-)
MSCMDTLRRHDPRAYCTFLVTHITENFFLVNRMNRHKNDGLSENSIALSLSEDSIFLPRFASLDDDGMIAVMHVSCEISLHMWLTATATFAAVFVGYGTVQYSTVVQ